MILYPILWLCGVQRSRLARFFLCQLHQCDYESLNTVHDRKALCSHSSACGEGAVGASVGHCHGSWNINTLNGNKHQKYHHGPPCWCFSTLIWNVSAAGVALCRLHCFVAKLCDKTLDYFYLLRLVRDLMSMEWAAWNLFSIGNGTVS